MTKLYDGLLADLFSNSLKYNPEIRALSFAIREEKKRILDNLAGTHVLSAINELPEAILDELAIEWRTPIYRQDLSLAAKRRLIIETMPFYSMAGTPEAVNRMLAAVYPESYVEEWPVYDGTPYHFRVIVEIHYASDPVDIDGIFDAVDKSKRLSAHLDDVILRSTQPIYLSQTAGYVIYTGIRCGLYPQTATLGEIVDTDIVITPELSSSVYGNPRTGEHPAGIWPHSATLGAIDQTDIHVSEDGRLAVYTELRGQTPAGIRPQTATLGDISSDSIKLAEETVEGVWSVSRSGLAPETAVLGVMAEQGVQVSGEGGYMIYSEPKDKDMPAGLYPQSSKLGGMSSDSMKLSQDSQYGTWSVSRSGLAPESAVAGEIIEQSVAVAMEGHAVSYSIPDPPEVDSGDYPETAEQGEQVIPSLKVEESSDSVYYSTPMCGSALSGIF